MNIYTLVKVLLDLNSLAEEAGQAAVSRHMKQLYCITKKLSGKYGQSEQPTNYKEGRAIMEKEAYLNRWSDHSEELLNRPSRDAAS